MALDRAYVAYVMELLSPLGQVTGRAMFGGYGIWERGDMFALLDSSSTLYFKAGASTEPGYRAAGSTQFAPEVSGRKAMPMPYWSVPADVLEDPELMAEWAGAAIAVAHATPKKAATPKKKAAPKKAATPKRATSRKAAPKAATPKKKATPKKAAPGKGMTLKKAEMGAPRARAATPKKAAPGRMR
jgi:DNA transformation protein and related proteins